MGSITCANLLAMTISFVSLLVSLGVLFIHRRNTKATIEQRLIERENKINDAFVTFEVRGPFAHHLRIPNDQVKGYTAKAVMLLHQINLLREVFQHRDILYAGTVEAYESWARTILRPWVEADDHLRSTFKLIIETQDSNDPQFIAKLKELLPIWT
ncbi:MAG: hypothetical protein M3436_13460 [Pseudomonadota bacterium]|nr:hypothetical protein [Pseudomonadota bacterium]